MLAAGLTEHEAVEDGGPDLRLTRLYPLGQIDDLLGAAPRHDHDAVAVGEDQICRTHLRGRAADGSADLRDWTRSLPVRM